MRAILESYSFSNGHSAAQQSFVNIDLYSSLSPSLSGRVQWFGNTRFDSPERRHHTHTPSSIMSLCEDHR